MRRVIDDMKTSRPVLYIFSGLPGTGKSTLARQLAQEFSLVYLRIDTVEQAIRDLCSFNVEGEGYRLSYRVARDNLSLGNSVVSDSCNPITLTRREWEQVALESQADYLNIEVICSDREEHRKRVESRQSDIPNLILPDWEQVENREYHPWDDNRVIIDTAFKRVEKSFQELKTKIQETSS